ncbi:hypothetical protein CAC42_7860 [Sphaceloma murrayae]|uniref:Luciferase domain-containing protein n=1 Tax=Sphaceloma murrayae TaxID=2082308 RepID=A0A2K1QYA1_9PEZI|nr:hypothetical protein CAC42_7860 [Sphaceloma murrayae]
MESTGMSLLSFYLLNASALLSEYRQILILVSLLAFLLTAIRVTYLDYHAFIALGPGGTPSTVQGYLKLKLLSLFRLRNTLAPPKIPSSLPDQSGYLSNRTLPHRVGPRPTVSGLAPQRQIDSFATAKSYEKTTAAINDLARTTPGLKITLSPFEKHSDALVATKPVHNRKRGGEVCHVHPSDGSLHLTLHPADVALCIERGWGERHPLARGGWMTRFVPETFVMVYAPRTGLEVQTVLDIVEASVWWVGGESVLAQQEGREQKEKQQCGVLCTLQDREGAGKMAKEAVL